MYESKKEIAQAIIAVTGARKNFFEMEQKLISSLGDYEIEKVMELLNDGKKAQIDSLPYTNTFVIKKGEQGNIKAVYYAGQDQSYELSKFRSWLRR